MLTESIAVFNRGDATLLNSIRQDVDRDMLKFADLITKVTPEQWAAIGGILNNRRSILKGILAAVGTLPALAKATVPDDHINLSIETPAAIPREERVGLKGFTAAELDVFESRYLEPQYALWRKGAEEFDRDLAGRRG